MHYERAALLALLAASGCQSTPNLFDALPDPLPRLADAEALVVADGLRKGDRIEYAWTSRLSGEAEHATIRLTVEEIGTASASHELAAAEVAGLREVGQQMAVGLGLPFALELVDEDRRHAVPAGSHVLAVELLRAAGPVLRDRIEMPIACEGRGMLTARRLVHAQIANQGAPLDLDGLFDLVFSLYAPALFEQASVLADLPGLDRAAEELVAKPSLWTAALGWMAAATPQVECPFWKPWSTVDGRYLAPLRVAYHGHALVEGYLEVAPARGLLAAVSGIVGFRVWRPGAPERFLEARLVAAGSATPASRRDS